MMLQEVHARSLEKSTALSGFAVKSAIPPRRVIAALNAAGVSFVLIGAHGLAGWMKKPRATEDVDLLIAAKHHKKAIKSLLTAFPHLEADDHPDVTRLIDRKTREVVIDLLKPAQQLLKAALKHTEVVRSAHQTYRIPSLEMALALKFAAMISLQRRDADKFQDAHDFIYMIESNPDIDLEKLAELGQLLYSDGGKEIVEKVKQVRAGEKLIL